MPENDRQQPTSRSWVEGGGKWSFDDGRGCGVKICVAGQVATAGLGTSARGSPKQMGGAATTYNFRGNAGRSLRQQCQSCGGGSPALSCFATLNAANQRPAGPGFISPQANQRPSSAPASWPHPCAQCRGTGTSAQKANSQLGTRRSHSGPWLASWLGSGSPTTPPNQSTIRHLNQKPPSRMTEQLRPPETLCSLPLPPIPHMNFILPLKNALHFASRCRPALARHIFTRHRLPRQTDESTISNDARCGLAMQVPR